MRRPKWPVLAVACGFVAGCGASGHSATGTSDAATGDSGAAATGGPSVGDGASMTSSEDAARSPDGASSAVETGAAPASTCQAPIALADASHPTATVGDGDAGGCTEGALRAAVHAG